MDELFDEVSDDYQDISEPEHFDEVAQGVMEVIVGTESLSKAQRYLYSCLEASDSITFAQRRDGAEGIFSAIGEGFKAAWDFLMRLFKAAWNFFFGKGDGTIGSKADKASDTITENEKTLKESTQTGKADAVVEKKRAKAKEKVKKIINSSTATSAEKNKAQDINKKLNEGNVKPIREKEKEVDKIVEELANIDKDMRQGIIKGVGSAEALRRKFVAYGEKDRSSEIGEGRFKSMYKVFREALTQGAFGKPINEIVKVDSMKTMSQAVATQHALNEAVKQHKRVSEFFASERNDFEVEIKVIKDLIASKSKDSNSGQALGEPYKNKGELRARLTSAQTALSIVNATAGFQSKMLAALERLSGTINALYLVEAA